MSNANIKIEHNDPLTDDVPLSKENLNYRTFLFTDDGNDVFLFRMYTLSENYKEENYYPFYTDYELGDIYMFPDYRGQKLSKLLLSTFLKFVDPGDNIILWVLGNNVPAIKLYKSLGFKKLATNNVREEKIREKHKWIKDSDEIVFFMKYVV